MSRYTRYLGQHAERVRAKAARPEHVSATARQVAGAFPAKFAKAVDVNCACGTVIYAGEMVVRRNGSGSVVHALCEARVQWFLAQPVLAAVEPVDKWLARRVAVARVRKDTHVPHLTVDEGALLDSISPEWRSAFRYPARTAV